MYKNSKLGIEILMSWILNLCLIDQISPTFISLVIYTLFNWSKVSNMKQWHIWEVWLVMFNRKEGFYRKEYSNLYEEKYRKFFSLLVFVLKSKYPSIDIPKRLLKKATVSWIQICDAWAFQYKYFYVNKSQPKIEKQHPSCLLVVYYQP